MEYIVTITGKTLERYVLGTLKNIKGVSVKPLDQKEEHALLGLRKAVQEVALAEQGKLKLLSKEEILNGLRN